MGRNRKKTTKNSIIKLLKINDKETDSLKAPGEKNTLYVQNQENKNYKRLTKKKTPQCKPADNEQVSSEDRKKNLSMQQKQLFKTNVSKNARVRTSENKFHTHKSNENTGHFSRINFFQTSEN